MNAKKPFAKLNSDLQYSLGGTTGCKMPPSMFKTH